MLYFLYNCMCGHCFTLVFNRIIVLTIFCVVSLWLISLAILVRLLTIVDNIVLNLPRAYTFFKKNHCTVIGIGHLLSKQNQR